MLVRYENLTNGISFLRNVDNARVKEIENTSLCSVDGVVYWVNKIIYFTSHINILIIPIGDLKMQKVSKNLSVVPTDEELALFAKAGEEVIDRLKARIRHHMIDRKVVRFDTPKLVPNGRFNNHGK